jgi:UDP:flavonoid glycosyltransferase YjiC (YdhE family)
MRMTLLGFGYRGDIQPLVALAAGLRAAGHAARVATHDDFADLVRGASVPFHRLSSSAAAFIGGPAGAALRDRMTDPERFTRFVDCYLSPFLPSLFDEVWEACRDAEVVFGDSFTRTLPSLAERLKVPTFVVATYPLPHLPTRAFPYPFGGDSRAPSPDAIRNRSRWSHGRLLYAGFAQTVVDHWRQQTLDLPPKSWRDERLALRRMPHLLGFSPLILGRPREWPSWVHVTGYWFLKAPPEYRAPPELEKFLDNGPPPIAITFSSQVARHTSHLTSVVIEGLHQSGRRGVLLSGWGGLRPDRQPPEVIQVPAVPHDWLFPRVAAVVHHGGSGTTASALRAGVPNVAVPFGFDQHLWGQQLARLGVGPEPLSLSSLTAEDLAGAIRNLVSDDSLRRRARAIAETLCAEDGVANAVAIIQRYVANL